MPLPGFVLPTIGSFVLSKFLGNAFGGGGQGRPADPTQDSAIRASLISQGLAQPGQAIPGSNVPSVQGLPGGGGGSNIPTRGVLGLEGDAAFAATARAFREQLARQTAGEISDINRQFAGAGRFTSGQRLSTIQEAQIGAREEFGRFLGGTALERFLQQQRLRSAENIAQAQIEAQSGQGRTQLFGAGIGALGNIFAQNPQFLIDLFTRGGGSVDTGDPFARFDPNATTIQTL